MVGGKRVGKDRGQWAEGREGSWSVGSGSTLRVLGVCELHKRLGHYKIASQASEADVGKRW